MIDFLCFSAMYMLLNIYAISNITDISWGTREKQVSAVDKSKEKNGEKQSKYFFINL